MARKFAQIRLTVWGDADFRTLTRDAQWLYWALLSQPDLDEAGVLNLRERRWAQLAAGTSRADIERILAELETARFVVVDEDTEELLIRTYIRNDDVWRQPNMIKGSLDRARQVLSFTLRAVLAAELDRIPWDQLSGACAAATRKRAADAIAELTPEPAPGESETHAGTHAGTHPGTHGGRDAGTHPERVSGTHAGTHPGTPVEPMAEPTREPMPDGQRHPSGTGTGTVTPSVVGSSSSLTRDEKTISTITSNSDATADEAPGFIAHVRTHHRPNRFAGWLHTVAGNGDLQDLVDEWRHQATPAATEVAPRDRPRCDEHRLALPCTACAADQKAAEDPQPPQKPAQDQRRSHNTRNSNTGNPQPVSGATRATRGLDA